MDDDFGQYKPESIASDGVDLGQATLEVDGAVAVEQPTTSQTPRWHTAFLPGILLCGACVAVVSTYTNQPKESTNGPQVVSKKELGSPRESELAQAREALSRGDYLEATRICTDVLSTNPSVAEAIRIRAAAYALDGMYLACASDLEDLEKQPPYEFPKPSSSIMSAMYQAAVRMKSDALAAVDDGSFSHAQLLFSKSLRYATMAERLGSMEALGNLCVTLDAWIKRTDRMNSSSDQGSYDLDVRKWTSVDKKFSAKARFIAVSAGQVSLERDNGVRCTIYIHQLSAADRDWIAAVERRDQMFRNQRH